MTREDETADTSVKADGAVLGVATSIRSSGKADVLMVWVDIVDLAFDHLVGCQRNVRSKPDAITLGGGEAELTE